MKMKWTMVGILVVLPSLMYINCVHNDFVFDDVPLVSQNRGIRSLHSLPLIFSFKKNVISYRPVRMASYVLDYFSNKYLWSHCESLAGRYEGYDGGLNPFGYHISNLVYHLITVVLVFLVVNALTSNLLVAFIAALLFSIHPVHTESVAYISGRRDILSTSFYLLGFYSFIRYRASSQWKYSALFLLCYVLALGSKEMAVTLPLLCFCYEVVGCVQTDSTKGPFSSFKKIFSSIKGIVMKYRYFYLMLLIVAAYFTYYKVWVRSPSQRHSFYGESIYVHFLTVAKIMIHYLKLMFYPINLTADYSYNSFPLARSLFEPSTFTALLIVVFLLYGLWRLLNTSPLLSFGVLWWFLTLLPVCQIFPHHELLAEHYLYLPSVGFFLCGALIITKEIEAAKWRTITCISLCVVVALFSVRTAYRNLDWRDGITLWEKTIMRVPHCVRAQNNLGVWYYTQRRYQEAVERHQFALKLNPRCADSYNNLGNAYLAVGLFKEAEDHYKNALQIDPSYEEAYNNLGMLYIKEGKYEDARDNFLEALRLNRRFANPHHGLGVLLLEYSNRNNNSKLIKYAVKEFQKAIRLNPYFAEAHSNLGSLYSSQGKLQEAMNELIQAVRLKPDLLEAHKNLAKLYQSWDRKDESIHHYSQVLRLNQGYAEGHYQLGVLYSRKGEYDKALEELKEGIRIKPDFAEVHNQLGIVYKAKKEYSEAVNEYKKALSLSPDYIEACYNLALAYQSMGMDDEAIKHYQRAVELKPDFTHALNNMGGLYARRGNHEKAVKLFKKVVEIAPHWALAHNNLGNVYRERGYYLKALKEYEIAAHLDRSYCDPHFNLAQLYLKDLEDIEKALYHYKKCIAINPNHHRVAALKREVEGLEKILHHSPAHTVRE